MTLFSNYIVFCCLTFTIPSAFSSSCDYVRNLPISYLTAESSVWNETIVNGCINETALNQTDVVQIRVTCKNTKNGQLKQIGPNFVNNIKTLEKLWISECKFKTIDPGAFTKLPKLTEFVIYENSLSEIRKGVFDVIPSVTTIHLHRNEISNIEDGAFANLPNLKFIDLNNNQCEYMRREWFPNTTGITTFFMAVNNLRQIPPRMFEGWRKLEWFNLNTNKISIIHDGAFKDIAPVIKNLDLHLNRLTTILLENFSDHVHIEILRLSANLLNYLPEEFIRKVNVDYLYVHGNPFKCSCLDRLKWILGNRGVIIDYAEDPYFYKPCYSESAPVCAVPLSFTQVCHDTVDKEVTRTYLRHLKDIGYDKSQSVKCAMFDALTIN